MTNVQPALILPNVLIKETIVSLEPAPNSRALMDLIALKLIFAIHQAFVMPVTSQIISVIQE
jgi:hypothetical protein